MTGDTIRIHLQWLDGRTLDLDWSGDEAQANPTTIQHDRREFTALAIGPIAACRSTKSGTTHEGTRSMSLQMIVRDWFEGMELLP